LCKFSGEVFSVTGVALAGGLDFLVVARQEDEIATAPMKSNSSSVSGSGLK